MKKTFWTALAALLLAVPAVQAQKVNKASILAKIEKCNADTNDAKKGIKASTWINLGKAYYEAASEPTKSIFVGMEASMLKLAIGDPTSQGTDKLGEVEYTTWVYPYFTLYIKDNKIATWKQSQWVMKEAASKAIDAYNKAYEIDAKSGDKVKEGLKQISDLCSQVGNVGLDSGDYIAAADAYAEAYRAQSSPAYGQADPALLYYAGYLRTIDGANNVESFVKGADYLQRAIDQGYADEEGSIYYYLFHCYYGQKANDKAFVMKAKDALLAGIEKFPKNERIVEGLVQLYTTPDDNAGDPAELVALIDKAVAENPDNTDLWFGRGRVFYALGNYDESIASFQKIVELKPDLFEGNYYLGVFYTLKAEALLKEINERQYSGQAAYDADLKVVNEAYFHAIPWLEKANELKPKDKDTLYTLKQLCFRFRDEEGMMPKYEKYNALYNEVKDN